MILLQAITEANAIPIPDSIFWYLFAIALVGIMSWIVKWWITRVESRQDSSDQKFNVFIQEMSEIRQTQTLQNQVLEQHSKFIEKEGSSIMEMTETMITTLKYLTSQRDKDEENPTVRRFKEKEKL